MDFQEDMKAAPGYFEGFVGLAEIVVNFTSDRFCAVRTGPGRRPESAPKAASNHWINERIFASLWFAGAAGNALLEINFMMTVAEISQPRR
jgi:hypothetical protein